MGSLNRKKPSDKKIKKAVLSGEARSKFEAQRKRMKANRDKGELLLERRSEMETKEPLENPQARYSSFRGDPSSLHKSHLLRLAKDLNEAWLNSENNTNGTSD